MASNKQKADLRRLEKALSLIQQVETLQLEMAPAIARHPDAVVLRFALETARTRADNLYRLEYVGIHNKLPDSTAEAQEE